MTQLLINPFERINSQRESEAQNNIETKLGIVEEALEQHAHFHKTENMVELVSSTNLIQQINSEGIVLRETRI